MALTNLEMTDYHLYATAENGKRITVGCAPSGYCGCGPERQFELSTSYHEYTA